MQPCRGGDTPNSAREVLAPKHCESPSEIRHSELTTDTNVEGWNVQCRDCITWWIVASLKRMHRQCHSPLARRCFECAGIAILQLVVASQAPPAIGEDVRAFSRDLQICIPFPATRRVTQRDGLIFMWEVLIRVVLANDLSNDPVWLDQII